MTRVGLQRHRKKKEAFSYNLKPAKTLIFANSFCCFSGEKTEKSVLCDFSTLTLPRSYLPIKCRKFSW